MLFYYMIPRCMLYSCIRLGLYRLRMIDLALFHVPCLVVDLGWSQLFDYLSNLVLCTTRMHKATDNAGAGSRIILWGVPRKLVVALRSMWASTRLGVV